MIWNKATHVKYKQLASAVGEHEMVPRDAVHMCCGSKDGQISDAEKVVTRLP